MGCGLSPVLRSGRAPVAAVASPGDAGFWIRGVWGEPYDEAMAAYARLGARARRRARAAGLAQRRRGSPSRWPTASTPYAERDGVDPLASSIAYPAESDFGERLRYLAAMIAQPLGIRVATSRPTATSTPTTTSPSWAACSAR